MNKPIQIELQDAFKSLIEELNTLSQDQLNQIPSSGGWTAAQVGDHLSKSYGIISLLDGKTTPTVRPVDQKAKAIKDMFLNFGIQTNSPDFIFPSKELIYKDALLQNLERKIQAINESIEKRDLTVTCLDFALPIFGDLTGWEWIHLTTYHTQRHLHQLEKIIRGIKVAE